MPKTLTDEQLNKVKEAMDILDSTIKKLTKAEETIKSLNDKIEKLTDITNSYETLDDEELGYFQSFWTKKESDSPPAE